MIRRFGARLLGAELPTPTAARGWQVLAVFAIGTLAVLFRLPFEHWNVLWAEDGGTFVPDAYRFDPRVLFETYAGYLHFVPRLLAGAAVAVVPIEYVPLAMTVLGALVVGLVSATVFLFARLRLRSVVVCFLLALQVAVLPIAGHEVFLNVAYLQWYLMFAAVWAVLVTPGTRGLVALQCVIVAAAILSEPVTAVLLLPFILVRVVAIRPWVSRAHAVTIVFIASSIVQGIAVVLAVLVQQRRDLSRTWPSPFAFAEDYGSRVALDSLLGVTGTTHLIELLGRPVIIGGLAAILVGVAVLARLDRDRRWLIVGLAGASVLASFVTEALSWQLLSGFSPADLLASSRYHVAPVLLLFSAYAVGADHLASRLHDRRLAWIPIVVLAAIVVIPGTVDYRFADQRANTADWIDQLQVARDTCSQNPNQAFVLLEVAPKSTFQARIPCEVLAED